MIMTYSVFIDVCNEKKLLIQHELNQNDEDKYYSIWAYDGNQKYECEIDSIDEIDEINDFETNYLAKSNQTIDKRDIATGMQIFKPKPVDAVMLLNHIYFKTGNDTSLDSGVFTDWHISTQIGGTSPVGSTPYGAFTYVYFLPEYGYYIDGGSVKVVGNMTDQLKMSLILAPDIPAEYGGSLVFLSNKKFSQSIKDDFSLITSAKYIPYNQENPNANKLMVIVEHSVDESVEIEIGMRIYRSV